MTHGIFGKIATVNSDNKTHSSFGSAVTVVTFTDRHTIFGSFDALYRDLKINAKYGKVETYNKPTTDSVGVFGKMLCVLNISSQKDSLYGQFQSISKTITSIELCGRFSCINTDNTVKELCGRFDTGIFDSTVEIVEYIQTENLDQTKSAVVDYVHTINQNDTIFSSVDYTDTEYYPNEDRGLSGYVDSHWVHPQYIEDISVMVDKLWKQASGLWVKIGAEWKNATPYARPEKFTVCVLHFDGLNGDTVLRDDHDPDRVFSAKYNAVISTTKSKFGYSSGYFDGTNDYFYAPYSRDFCFNYSDFTVDCWINATSFGENRIITGSNGNDFVFGWSGSTFGVGRRNFRWDVTVTHTMATNTWNHVAVTRVNGVLSLFINGILKKSQFWDIPYLMGDINIGGEGANYCMNGYIDELRIINGYGAWTNNFVLPDAPYPINNYSAPIISTIEVDSNTALLMHFEGVNNSILFQDAIKSRQLMANVCKISTAITPKFGASCAYFSGSDAYIYAPSGSTDDISFGTGDFTVDCWVYPTSISDTRILGGQTQSDFFFGWTSAAQLGVGKTNVIWTHTTSNAVITLNTWQHLAVTRYHGVLYLFRNGVMLYGCIDSNNYPITSRLHIGINEGGQFDLYGYMDELRIVKGIGAWATHFTPPTVPYVLGTTPTGPYIDPTDLINATKLLMHCEGTEGSGDIIDSSGSRIFAAVNGAKLTTTLAKFGSSSLSLNGTSDYAVLPNASDVSVGTGDFTIDFWIYATSWVANKIIIGGYSTGDFHIGIPGNNYQISIGRHQVNWDTTVNHGMATNTWNHVAFCRTAGKITIFINGIIVLPATINTQSYNVTHSLNLGQVSNNYYFGGCLDEIRIVKGYGVWTSSFNVPTEPYAIDNGYTAPTVNYSDYTTLMHFSGANNSTIFTDSITNNNYTPSGDAKISTTKFKFDGSSMALDGAGDCIKYTSSTVAAFGTDDFTVDFWINQNSMSNTIFYSSQAGAGEFFMGFMSSTQIGIGKHQVTWDCYVNHGMVANTWYHIAICRRSSILFLIVDGVILYTMYNTQNYSATGGVSIGNLATGWYINGYIDEFRTLKGKCAFLTRFTPPTAPYTL